MAIGLEDLPNLVPVQIVVLSNLVLQVTLFLCAGVRRKETSSAVPVRLILLWIAYNFSETIATYTLARLSFFSAQGSHPLLALWAPFLLLHLAGPDNIAAYAMQDNQLSLRSLQTYFAQFIAGGAYFLYKYRNDRGHFLGLATWLMFSVGVVKYSERWLALQRGKLSSIRESIMMQPLYFHTHAHQQDVKFKNLEGSKTLEDEFSVRRAHSLFSICMAGMVGCSDDVPRMQNFMEKMEGVEWWTVVEIELSLMYDILYTKAAVIHTWHGYAIRVLSPLAILTSLLFFIFREEDGQGAFDTATTYVLFVSALFMDLISLLNTLGSSWMYAYLSTTRSTWLRYTFLCSGRWDRFRRLVLSLHSLVTCGISSRSGARRWSGHMGQYNMLHFCTRPNSLLGRLAKLVHLELIWNRKHFSGATKISDPIKFYITEYANLLYMEGRFTLGTNETKWGIKALEQHQVVYQFEDTLGREFQEGIIIWHIGTDFFLSKCRSSNGQVLLVSAVKALSNYMMFLLVERPSVLPIIVKRMLYVRACEALQGMGRYHPTGICDMLHSLFSWHDDPANRATDCKIHAENLYNRHVGRTGFMFTPEMVRLTYSARVAEQLLLYEENHGTTKSLELVLAVWTDMLVYAASRCTRRDLDAEKLSSGGELITIVWLMLEHFHQASLQHHASI